MKTFSEFMNEEFSQGMKDCIKNNDITRKMQAREPTEPSKFPPSDPNWAEKMHSKFDAIANRRDAPRTVKPEPVDTTGANSPFADPQVKSYVVTPDKPMVGKDDAIKKLLASKGYGPSGKKLTKPAARPFPDMPPQKQFGQDTKMKLLKIDRKISSDTAKMNEPAKVQPKVGSLVVKQSGYPAAKKQVAPIPKARPAKLVPKKSQSFKQAFAAAPEGSTFTYKGKKYLRKTKK